MGRVRLSLGPHTRGRCDLPGFPLLSGGVPCRHKAYPRYSQFHLTSLSVDDKGMHQIETSGTTVCNWCIQCFNLRVISLRTGWTYQRLPWKESIRLRLRGPPCVTGVSSVLT